VSSTNRLPIDHPDYRYPSSRNPYFLKVRDFPSIIFTDNDTEAHAGAWLSQFRDGKTKRPLHVEIGCNGGHVTLEWAAREPRAAWIGLDWKFKQIHRGAEKADKRGLGNLIFLRGHADRLRYMFGDGEIDHLYLYFPDPWPKKSQWKHRWLNATNLKVAAQVVRPGGTFHIKTDHAGYFEWMLAAVESLGPDSPWKVERQTRDLHAGNPDPLKLEIPDVTLFEKIFIRKAIPINSLWLVRR
jgi:tRNA (guanine-N7-)-methyltransferase